MGYEHIDAMGFFQGLVDAAPVLVDSEEQPTPEQERWARAALSSAWQQRFSVALQRGNAAIVVGRARALRDR